MAALKRAVPRGGSVKVVTSSADVSSPRARRAREKDVDLRAIINQSREERTRCVQKEGDVGWGWIEEGRAPRYTQKEEKLEEEQSVF